MTNNKNKRLLKQFISHKLDIPVSKIGKEWIPYKGPHGGEGWQSTHDADDVRYQENPPGEIADGWEEQAEGWGENPENQEDEMGMEDAVEIAKDVLNVTQFNTGAETIEQFVSLLESTVEDDRFPTTEHDMERIRERLDVPSKDERNEWGRQERRPTIDLETPESRVDLTPMDLHEYDAWDDDGSPQLAQQEMANRLEAKYENGDEAYWALYDWQNSGYDFVDEVWAAAMALEGVETIPNHYAKYGKSFDPDDTYKPLVDVIRMSREQAKADFGDETTVYRGFKKSTLEKYAKQNDDGSVAINPQILESWTIEPEIARNHGDRRTPSDEYVVAEMTVSTDNVAFYGPFALGGVNTAYKELTLSRTKPYTIPADQLDNYDPDEFTMKKSDIPRLPVWASNWMRQPSIEMDGVEKIAKTWIPYQGPHGGEGWQNAETGEVRYVEEPPGPVAGQDDTPVAHAPQRWGSWDEDEEEDVTEEAPDEPDMGDDEITWDNVQVGDEVAYRDDYGELQHGEVTAVEQDGFGVVWVKPEDGGTKVPVERDDFEGDIDSLIGETVEAPDHIDAAWMDENLFFGQQVKVYNNRTDEVQYGDVTDLTIAGGEIQAVKIRLEQSNGFGATITITNDEIDWHSDDDNEQFEIRATTDWKSLDEGEQQDALTRAYHDTVNMRNMPSSTRQKVHEQMTDHVIPAFKDMDVARETMKSLFRVENEVSRANCRGTGSVRIALSSNAPLLTTQHEMGHAIISSFGYNYASGFDELLHSEEKYRRRPTNLSHEHDEIGDALGHIDFEFSEDSNFFAPEEYMLQKTDAESGLDTDIEIEAIEAGDELQVNATNSEYDTTKVEVTNVTEPMEATEGRWTIETKAGRPGSPHKLYVDDSGDVYDYKSFDGGFVHMGQIKGRYEAKGQGFSAWKDGVEDEVRGIEHPDLDEREYEEPGNKTAKDIFESLDDGDVVRLNVPSREPEVNHLIFRGAEDRWNDPDNENDDSKDFLFEKPNGNEWHWAYDRETGELVQSEGSRITGFDDTYSDHQEASESVDHSLENWDGFIENPETTTERVDNLASAANRAWYKQAKMMELNDDRFDVLNATIGSGYSATNAHETIAKTHEVIQSGDTFQVRKLTKHHPYLVAAYTDVFTLPRPSQEAIQNSDTADKYGIEP